MIAESFIGDEADILENQAFLVPDSHVFFGSRAMLRISKGFCNQNVSAAVVAMRVVQYDAAVAS